MTPVTICFVIRLSFIDHPGQ